MNTQFQIHNAFRFVQLPQSELLRNQKIVLFSDDNIDAAKAWFILKSKGYKGVYILDGGLDAGKKMFFSQKLH